MQDQNVVSDTITPPDPSVVASNPTDKIEISGSPIEQVSSDAPLVKDRAYFNKAIRLRWNKARESIMEVGRLLIEARKTLPKDEYSKFINNDLPFDYSVIRKLVNLAESKRINDPKHTNLLPHSWNTLAEIMQLPDEAFEFGIKEGIIHEKTPWKKIKDLRQMFDPPLPKPPAKATAAATAAGRAVSLPLNVKSKSAPTVNDGSKATISVKRSDLAKGTILVVVSQETATTHTKELADLNEDLLRLVSKYPFIGEVKVESRS